MALPMLVHCTQGKDRTGLVVLLVLEILGISLDAIDFDYRLTDEALSKEEGAGLKEMRFVGLPDEFRRTAPDLVHKVHQHLQDTYGGLESYLDTIGFDEMKRSHMRELLLY
jgi:protein-tyrosine phosphatase